MVLLYVGYLTNNPRTANISLQSETKLQGKEKLSMKDETYEDIDGEVDKDELYKIHKTRFYVKEWHKRVF